jgi:hypothetical protein
MFAEFAGRKKKAIEKAPVESWLACAWPTAQSMRRFAASQPPVSSALRCFAR